MHLKYGSFTVLALSLCLASCNRPASLDEGPEEGLVAMPIGRYLGFTPSSDSQIGFGETEMNISASEIQIMIATGKKIRSFKVSTDSFTLISRQEIEAILKSDTPYTKRITVFKHKLNESGFPFYLFFKDPNEHEFRLVILNGSAREVNEAAYFFDYTQIARGDYMKALSRTYQKYGAGSLPLLGNGGKASQPAPRTKSF